VSLLFAIVAMTAICAVCSLGADYARVQLAKTELRRAADAAARAASAALPSGVTATQAAASTYGGYNTVDGVALTIDPNNDVEFGTWDGSARTFTVLSGAARSNANSVRVTARRTAAGGNAIPLYFARVLGRSSCDVTAQAVATYTASAPTGFMSLTNVDLGNNALVRSYNANSGAPGGANLTSSAQVGANGALTFGNNTDVYGDLVKGPSATLSNGNHFYLGGSQLGRPNALSYTATEAPTVASGGSLSIGNNQTYTMPAGTYNFTDITVGNSVTINATGAVTVYLTGGFTAGNNFTFNAYQNKPANASFRLAGTGRTFSAGNGLDLTAQVYGPGWDFTFFNNARIEGSVVANTIDGGTNASLYYDTSLGTGGTSSGSVSTVK
jgi:hypothetical protein